MDHRFQIDLRGIIDLLSNHLYSTPQVFVRELLQNAADALRARRAREPGHLGEIRLEVIAPRNGAPTLVVEDDGIGLTEAQVHEFLATIGSSSKRGDLDDARNEFIGQFGIGLLSCFVVSDEIVMVTRAPEPDAPTVEWRGRVDGTYALRTLAQPVSVGTRVYLRCQPGREEFFEPDRLLRLARHYGEMLPFPIHFSAGERHEPVNAAPPPWRRSGGAEAHREALLAYGREALGSDFFDAVPLHADAGELEGVAFVLPYSPSPARRGDHRVYLKGMFLSDKADGLLPDWAFFVRCVINAGNLRPTASREGFYEDETLAAAREALGGALRDWLIGLAHHDPGRLQALIGLHHLAIKALAVHDDECYRLFIDFLPFETTLGQMTLGEYRRGRDVIQYVPTRDQFRQIAPVATAQSLAIINGGYTYDSDLLERLPELFGDLRVELVDAADVAETFAPLSDGERRGAASFLAVADDALAEYECAARIARFEPAALPAIYSSSTDAYLQRSLRHARDLADEHWGGVLDNLGGALAAAETELCFNHSNALVQRLLQVSDERLLALSVRMLYVQALLLGHHPLTAKETRLLNEGLLGLIDASLAGDGHGDG